MIEKPPVVADTSVESKNVQQFNCKGDREVLKKLNSEGITLTVGSEAKIALSSNPTTGYGWIVNKESPEGKFACEATYTADPAPEMMCGVGGTGFITIKGLEEGEGTLKAVYARSWEFDADDWDKESNMGMRKIEAKVTVKKAEEETDEEPAAEGEAKAEGEAETEDASDAKAY